jgi:hypothetical protein
MTSFDVASLQASVVDSGRSKSAPIVDGAGKPAKWRVGPLQVAFPPKGFSEDQARISFCLRSTPEICKLLKELDEWAVAWAHANSLAAFGKQLSLDQVTDKLSPALKASDKYDALARAKINPKYVRWWDANGKRREAPEDWRGVACTAEVLVKSLWFMGGQFGVTLEIQDAQLTEASTGCPF